MIKKAFLSLLIFFLFTGIALYFTWVNYPQGEDNLTLFEPIQQPTEQTIAQTITENQATSTKTKLTLVTKVLNGDTVEIEGGRIVRYIGITAPKSKDPSVPVELFSQEAINKNKELVEGKRIRLEKDISEVDVYNRLLRYVFLEDNTFVNLELVRLGLAEVKTYPPDIRYEDQLFYAQRESQNKKLGLWNSGGAKVAGAATSQNCLIKGRIDNYNYNNNKFYYLPEQSFYQTITIDPEKGDRWFCSEEEAQKEGFTKGR